MIPVHYLRADSIVEAEKSLLSDIALQGFWNSWFESLPVEKKCSHKVSYDLREEFTVKLLNAYCGCIMKVHKSRFSNTRNNGSVKLLLREQLKGECAHTSKSNKATASIVRVNPVSVFCVLTNVCVTLSHTNLCHTHQKAAPS